MFSEAEFMVHKSKLDAHFNNNPYTNKEEVMARIMELKA